jgi:hypothetical protein
MPTGDGFYRKKLQFINLLLFYFNVSIKLFSLLFQMAIVLSIASSWLR